MLKVRGDMVHDKADLEVNNENSRQKHEISLSVDALGNSDC